MRSGKTITAQSFIGIDERAVTGGFGSAVSMSNLKITGSGGMKVRDAIVRKMPDVNEKIILIWSGKVRSYDCVVVVTTGGVYSYEEQTGAYLLLYGIAIESAQAFLFGDMLYILTGRKYLAYNGIAVGAVTGYVPLIAVSTPPAGGGTLYEGINLITPQRRQLFSLDGVSDDFQLAEKGLSSIVYVKINGVSISSQNYTHDLTNGIVHMHTVPGAGTNTLEICYSVGENERELLDGCTGGCTYGSGNDTRVFLFGNPDYPVRRFHSELAGGLPSAAYFTATGYTEIPGHCITSIIRHYDRQLIFTKTAAFYSTDELLADSTGRYYHSYPIYSLNSEKGHIAAATQACLIDNCPVTVCGDGIYKWTSTAVRDERNAVCISERVAGRVREMIENNDDHPVRLFDNACKTELWVYNDLGSALIYNYGADVWYYYTGLHTCIVGSLKAEMLMGSSTGGLYCFSDTQTLDFGTTRIAFSYESGYCTLGGVCGEKNISELSVCLRPDRETAFSLTLMADGDEKTTCSSLVSASPPESGDAGLVKRVRRVSLRRLTAAKLVINDCTDGAVCNIVSFSVKASSCGREIE